GSPRQSARLRWHAWCCNGRHDVAVARPVDPDRGPADGGSEDRMTDRMIGRPTERSALPDGLPGLMDLPRTGVRPRTRRAVLAAAAAVALAAITLGVRWLGHRAPLVPRDQLWIATVQRGALTLSVRGQG